MLLPVPYLSIESNMHNRVKKRPIPIPIEDLMRSAINGDPEAQFVLGLRCFVGSGVVKDNELACEWLRKAKYLGHPQAGRFLEMIIKT